MPIAKTIAPALATIMNTRHPPQKDLARSVADELNSALHLMGRFTVKEGAEGQLSLFYEAGPGPMVFLKLGPRIISIEGAQELARVVDGSVSEVVLDFGFSPHANLGLPQSILDKLLACVPEEGELAPILIAARGQELLADNRDRLNRIVSVVSSQRGPSSIEQLTALAQELVSIEFHYRVAKKYSPSFRNRRRKTEQAIKRAKRFKFELDTIIDSIIAEIDPVRPDIIFGKHRTWRAHRERVDATRLTDAVEKVSKTKLWN